METVNSPVPQSSTVVPPPNHSLRNKKIFSIGVVVAILVLGTSLFLGRTKIGQRIIERALPQLIHNDEELKLVEGSPSNYSTDFPLVGQPTFVFNKPLKVSEEKLTEYFQIEPKVDGTWKLEKNKQVVYLASNKRENLSLPKLLNANTLYTVSINKNISSVDGKLLQQEKKVFFRTKQDSRFVLRPEKKLSNTFIGNESKISFNVSSSNPFIDETYTLQQWKVTPQKVLEYFRYKKNEMPVFGFESKNLGTPQQETTVGLGPSSISPQYRELTIPAFTEPGVYYFVLKNDTGYEDFFVVNTDQVAQFFKDTKNGYVWITNAEGVSVPGATLQVYTLNEQLRKVGSYTATDGSVKVTNTDKIDMIVTDHNNTRSFIFTPKYWESIRSDYTVFPVTDRPVYRPGDKVHYKASIRQVNKGEYQLPKGEYFLRFDTDYQSKIEEDESGYNKVAVDANGSVIGDFVLPTNMRSLFPRIVLAQKKGEEYSVLNTHEINVESYRKPDLEIEVQAREKEYISKDQAHFTLSAKTLYGQPLANMDFSYRLLINPFNEVENRAEENIEQYFNNYYYGDGKTLATGTSRFDEKGNATLELSTDLTGHESSQIALIEVTPKINVAPSIGKVVRLIHRGEIAFFVDDMKANNTEGIQGEISVMSHDTPRQAIADRDLSVVLRRAEPDGSSSVLATQDLKSGSDGRVSFSFDEKGIGQYEIVVTGRDGRENTVTTVTSTYLGAATNSDPFLPRHFFTLKADKAKYKAGETAVISWTSDVPVAEIGLIKSAASNTIIEWNKQSVNASEGQLSVIIPTKTVHPYALQLSSVYEGMTLVGGTNISIDNEPRNISTKINFDKKSYKPGEVVQAEVQTVDANASPIAADVSLSVVDAAVLQVGDFAGKIADIFFQPITAYTSTYNSAEGIYNLFPGGGGGCFVGGTQILMADGTTKSIEAVVVGDKILTKKSDESNELVSDRVVKTFQHVVDEYLVINERLRVTPVHRLYVNRNWVQASEIHEGDILIDDQGQEVSVASIEKYSGKYMVYNLSTERQHTFFADGLYVHNEKGMSSRQNFADTAYWNPHVQTDLSGKAKVSFKLPDSVTTFTVKAYSQSGSSYFGEGTAEFISQKDLVIIPALPAFFYEDDRPVFTALIQNVNYPINNFEFIFKEKTTGIEVKKELSVEKGSTEEISLPIQLKGIKNEVEITMSVRDTENNKVVDSVLLKKDVLPKGNIYTSWRSFTGSQPIEFKPEFPQLDVNTLHIEVLPHIAGRLISDTSLQYVPDEISAQLGNRLFVLSNVLSLVESGAVTPEQIRGYGAMKNAYRRGLSSVFTKVKTEGNSVWWEPSYFDNDSTFLTSLWIVNALQSIESKNMTTEVEGMPDMIRKALTTQQAVTQSPQTLSREEALIRFWVLGETSSEYLEEPEFLAAQVLRGDGNAMKKMLEKRIISAEDRSFWNTQSRFGQVLPALAVLEKGNKAEKDRVSKALAVEYNNGLSYESQPMALWLGLKHLADSHLKLEKPQATLRMADNKNILFDQQMMELTESFSSKDSKDKPLSFTVEVKGELPMYTTLSEVSYGAGSKKSFSFGSSTQAKMLETPVQRIFRSVEGPPISAIEAGSTGIIELSLKNPFVLAQSKGWNRAIVYDSISPNLMVFNQINDNSPQYQNTLENIYPAASGQGYISPNDYSDQIIAFQGNVVNQPVIFPYIVYKISNGTHYQPKTSVLFPILGVIASEE